MTDYNEGQLDNIDEPDKTTDDRWYTYKRQCRERGIEPLSYGKWLDAGQFTYGWGDE